MIIFHFFYSISTAYAYVWYTTNGNDDDHGGFGRNRPTCSGVAYCLSADEMDTKRMRLHNVFNVLLTGALVGDQQGFCGPKFRLLLLFPAHYLLVLRQSPMGVQLVRPRESLHPQRQHMPAHLRQRRECKSICIYLLLHHLSPANIREFAQTVIKVLFNKVSFVCLFTFHRLLPA